MEKEDKIEVNLRKYKGHYRKFPWALIVRIVVILASLGVIFFMMQLATDLKAQKQQKDTEIEIEIPD